jgi:hypothetical protein
MQQQAISAVSQLSWRMHAPHCTWLPTAHSREFHVSCKTSLIQNPETSRGFHQSITDCQNATVVERQDNKARQSKPSESATATTSS